MIFYDYGWLEACRYDPDIYASYQQWTPERLKNRAKDAGPDVLTWVDTQLTTKAHPEQAYRVCLGLLNLSRAYPARRINTPCKIANVEGLLRLKQMESTLKSNRYARVRSLFLYYR
ncbi:MAG: hypothetical protein QNK24_07730 [Desulfuromusa sp.]|nr:hypothetical protein [Desulfuromusa sp.]